MCVTVGRYCAVSPTGRSGRSQKTRGSCLSTQSIVSWTRLSQETDAKAVPGDRWPGGQGQYPQHPHDPNDYTFLGLSLPNSLVENQATLAAPVYPPRPLGRQQSMPNPGYAGAASGNQWLGGLGQYHQHPHDPNDYNFLGLSLPTSSVQNHLALAGPVHPPRTLAHQQSMPNAAYAAGAPEYQWQHNQGQDRLALSLHPPAFATTPSASASSSSLAEAVPSIQNLPSGVNFPPNTEVVIGLSNGHGARGLIKPSYLPIDEHPQWIYKKKADYEYAVYILLPEKAAWMGKPKYVRYTTDDSFNIHAQVDQEHSVPVPEEVYLKIANLPESSTRLRSFSVLQYDQLFKPNTSNRYHIYVKNIDGKVYTGMLKNSHTLKNIALSATKISKN
ncbi:uncharacterized protein LOC117173771 [Belonocnema kinseyi]|uniref:uncharacterized protein LOC117173771 n=1 Tax=Belonocnema kinseyi TaxID=2817044 RepID=UPI00143D7C97|nr:uncharacterized protein LOC117173771 [Belonocnema kinseyi]